MAETALQLIVSPFVDLIYGNLASLIAAEFRLLRGVREDLNKLSTTLSTLRLVLEDAEEKQIKDKPTRDWLRKLKGAAYDAQDILEECQLEAHLQLESEDRRSCSEQVSDSFSSCFDFKQTMFRHKMGKKIKQIRDKFDEIAAERLKFHLSPGVTTGVVDDDVRGPSRETSSFLAEPVIYGRDDDIENIVGTLLDNVGSQNNVSICPILGIGGLGKTTLAQIIYNDDRVKTKFDTRIWICVSDDFAVKRITKMIIDHLSGKPCDLVDLDPMQNHLKRLLHGNKFLLVLDDVWDDSRENWCKMKFLLTCGDKGSSIIVTTRLQTVVDSMTCLQTVTESITCIINSTIKLKFLSEDDCWSLFKHCAFGMGNEEDESLIEIGQEIVRKCGGVPLAVKALGGLLFSKRWETWRLVRDSEIWNLEESTILPALRLSYNHLTPRMRQCFAYCSIYPKDYSMRKDDLIHQWIANGFIQSNRGNEVEDIGDEIFNGLLQWGFFQSVYQKDFAIYCNMHDLMHDLAQSVMVNECFIMKIDGIKDVPGPNQTIRYASMICESLDSLTTLNTHFNSQPFFRTLICIQYMNSAINTVELNRLFAHFSRVKCLRVLDLQDLWMMKNLPPWIGHLKHLRYLNLRNTNTSSLPKSICGLRNLEVLNLSTNERLATLPPSIGDLKILRCLDLSDTSIRELPESICSLTNLQTLNLRDCIKLKMLPREMRNMKNLRHLVIGWDYTTKLFIGGMPVGIGELTRLETLELFVVSPPNANANADSSEDGDGIQELERLNLLRGKLAIKCLRHVDDPSHARKANLRSKSKLLELELFWSDVPILNEDDSSSSYSWQAEENKMRISKEVLEGLQPHPNIQKLWIDGYPGVVLPSWVRDSLPKLISLTFHGMPNVEEEVVLPSCLESLLIAKCPKLRLPTTTMLPCSIQELGVERCNDPSLSSVETLPHLFSLRIRGFDEQETLPEAPLRNVTRLQELRIADCEKLKRLPTELENLATLKKLCIRNCGELDSMTEEGLQNLSSLEELRISDCRSLKSLVSLQHLTSLHTLVLQNCPDLEISAVDFQHLLSLRILTLRELPQLTCLPEGIQHATILRQLMISKCKNLRMLPEWLAQHQPPALYYLQILECHPDLHTRCEKDKGADWHKISHLRVVGKE